MTLISLRQAAAQAAIHYLPEMRMMARDCAVQAFRALPPEITSPPTRHSCHTFDIRAQIENCYANGNWSGLMSQIRWASEHNRFGPEVLEAMKEALKTARLYNWVMGREMIARTSEADILILRDCLRAMADMGNVESYTSEPAEDWHRAAQFWPSAHFFEPDDADRWGDQAAYYVLELSWAKPSYPKSQIQEVRARWKRLRLGLTGREDRYIAARISSDERVRLRCFVIG